MDGTVRQLRWGTSSFSEKSWVGPFYPPGTKPADFLTYYATQFDTVEVDATYYAVPDARTVEGWERKLPDEFTLCAKFPRTIVHCGERSTPDVSKVLVREHVQAETDLFLDRMRLLGGKCGPLVLQFPWFSSRAPLSSSEFLERLDAYLGALPRDFRYGVEVRNRDWIGEPLLALLRRHHVAFVWVELVNMPHPLSLAERLDIHTTDFAYARLIGDRKAVDRATKTFDRIVLDKSDSLQKWYSLIQVARTRASEIYVYANNHFAGHGPATTRALRELVEAEGA